MRPVLTKILILSVFVLVPALVWGSKFEKFSKYRENHKIRIVKVVREHTIGYMLQRICKISVHACTLVHMHVH